MHDFGIESELSQLVCERVKESPCTHAWQSDCDHDGNLAVCCIEDRCLHFDLGNRFSSKWRLLCLPFVDVGDDRRLLFLHTLAVVEIAKVQIAH